MNGSDQYETRAHPVLACLGVASRFRLVRALAVADRCVGELAEAVGLSQSCTTRHLQALERVGLVKGHREGRRVRFRLRSEMPGLRELLGWALSGPGREAPAAWGSPYADQDAARPIPTKADRPARPDALAHPQGRSAHTPRADSESRGPAGPMGLGDRDPQAVPSPRPARRPGDLEDYLL
jgi:DNA-binding transcriptional ArsR family regulator